MSDSDNSSSTVQAASAASATMSATEGEQLTETDNTSTGTELEADWNWKKFESIDNEITVYHPVPVDPMKIKLLFRSAVKDLNNNNHQLAIKKFLCISLSTYLPHNETLASVLEEVHGPKPGTNILAEDPVITSWLKDVPVPEGEDSEELGPKFIVFSLTSMLLFRLALKSKESVLRSYRKLPDFAMKVYGIFPSIQWIPEAEFGHICSKIRGRIKLGCPEFSTLLKALVHVEYDPEYKDRWQEVGLAYVRSLFDFLILQHARLNGLMPLSLLYQASRNTTPNKIILSIFNPLIQPQLMKLTKFMETYTVPDPITDITDNTWTYARAFSPNSYFTTMGNSDEYAYIFTILLYLIDHSGPRAGSFSSVWNMRVKVIKDQYERSLCQQIAIEFLKEDTVEQFKLAHMMGMFRELSQNCEEASDIIRKHIEDDIFGAYLNTTLNKILAAQNTSCSKTSKKEQINQMVWTSETASPAALKALAIIKAAFGTEPEEPALSHGLGTKVETS